MFTSASLHGKDPEPRNQLREANVAQLRKQRNVGTGRCIPTLAWTSEAPQALEAHRGEWAEKVCCFLFLFQLRGGWPNKSCCTMLELMSDMQVDTQNVWPTAQRIMAAGFPLTGWGAEM